MTNKIIDIYNDTVRAKEVREAYIYIISTPPTGVDYTKVAISAFTALTEEELPIFFQSMKESMSEEMWSILTE